VTDQIGGSFDTVWIFLWHDQMSNVNVNLNSQIFNDGRFHTIQTDNITSELTLGLPLLASTAAPTEYTERGYIAYNESVPTVMFSDGFAWHDLGGGTVTSITAGTGLTATPTNPITTSGTLSITNTGVTAGAYTLTNLTVNAQGQITLASSGVTDASLVGNGTIGTPLALTTRGVAGTYSNPIITLNNQGVTTAIISTSGLTADWYTTAVSTGSSGTFNIPASALDATYANLTPVQLNTGTGQYTSSQTGLYSITVYVDSTSGGVGDFVLQTQIIKTDALATNKVIAAAAYLSSAGGPGAGLMYSVSTITTLNATNTVTAQVLAGGSGATYIAHVSIAYIN
jgi:hypothetical protein